MVMHDPDFVPIAGMIDFIFASTAAPPRGAESPKKISSDWMGATYAGPCNLAHRLRVWRTTNLPL
jgi:hypothetical protein